MQILVLNCGSASVKYQLIESDSETSLARGMVERITSYEEVVRCIIDCAVSSPSEVAAVGHRVVHGCGRFTEAVVLSESVACEIERFNYLAPLHNPPNVAGYRAARAVLPHCPHVAVFDTAFHQTIPPRAFLYGIPYELCRRHQLRRYGFHGTSHSYVAQRYARIQGRPVEDFRLITCHLGNGCSVCAVNRGKSMDTSMGFTPLEGLVMGSRGGDFDPGALLHLMEREGLDTTRTNEFLNSQCGLRGLSGISNDMRELLAACEQGHELARLAIDVFCYRLRKYIGAYFAILNGADAVIFTAGIGENAPAVRALACESLSGLGIAIDAEKNRTAIGVEADISCDSAPTRTWVIPTQEELMIARETRAAVINARQPEAR